MATEIPYKLYKYKDPSLQSRPELMPDFSMTPNSSYAASQMEEVTTDDFLQNYYSKDKAYYDDYYNRNTNPGMKEAFQGLVSSGQAGAGYVIDDQGRFMQKASLDAENANKAAVAAGTMKNIGTEQAPMYVPVGSAADLQQQGKSYEEQLAAPSVQQQIKDQNLSPVNPTAPPSFAEAMAQVYSSRSDLQELYNGDGSAKNPNDPRIAGIPTLMDWVKKFGIKEDPGLAAAYPEYQKQLAAIQLTPSPTADPAQKYLEEQVNQGLSQGNATGNVPSLVNQANNLGTQEAAAVSAAQAAADMKDFMGLDKLMTELEGIRAERSQITNQILQALQKSEAEKAQELELQNLKSSAQQGLLNIEGEPIPMPFIVGQSRELEKSAQLKISNAVANLERLTGERMDKLETLKFMYDASSNDFADAVEMYKMSAPENIYTDVDSQGNLVTVMQNPLTGEIMRRNLGKVGDNKEWEKNKDLSLQNPGNNPFFSLDGRTILNRQSGRAYESMEQFIADGGNADASNVDWMSGDQQIIKNATLGLMDKYWDAGILPSDSYATAMQKAKTGSRIYAEQVRPPQGSGSDNSGDDATAKRDARVKQIITAYPHWQAAATQIDKEFGSGTATIYDALLKSAFTESSSSDNPFN